MSDKEQLVKVINDFIDLPLTGFTANEMNLLTTFLYKCKDQGANEVKLTFSEVRSIANFTSRNNKLLAAEITSTNARLQKLSFAIQTDPGVLKQLVLFPTFTVNTNSNELTLKVNEDFMYILNDLEEGYTKYDATVHNSLRSRFSKIAYRMFRKFSQTGIWVVKADRFNELFGVSDKYRQSDIDTRILDPILSELSPYFDGLTLTKTFKTGGRGRPVVSGYEFRWNPQKRIAAASDEQRIKPEETGYSCPACGEKLYLLHGPYGPFYGHPGGSKPGAKCSRTYGTLGDIKATEKKLVPSTRINETVREKILETEKEKEKKTTTVREEILKAAPALKKRLLPELLIMIDAYESLEREGKPLGEAENRIREYLSYLEAVVENAGYSKRDLYAHILQSDEYKKFSHRE